MYRHSHSELTYHGCLCGQKLRPSLVWTVIFAFSPSVLIKPIEPIVI